MEPLTQLPLSEGIVDSALAFRGYNITNLGRTPELLAVPAYRATILQEFQRFGAIGGDVTGTTIDLLRIVEERLEPDLDHYGAAVALIVAVASAQLRLLREVHGVDYMRAKLVYGYSLGEMSAVCATGAFAAEDLIRIPLAMARDCGELARDVTMGVLFSRDESLAEDEVRRLCVQITREGQGTIGVSSVLSPNSYLVIGQRDSVARFKAAMPKWLPPAVHLRINSYRWPPLHTPIVRQRYVPDRASVLMEAVPGRPFPARPAVVSLVTGKRNYDEYNAREILRQWIDHPQRLWDAVCETLAAGVKTLIHVGPEPNLIPATFSRLSDNVRQQTLRRRHIRAMSELVRRPWLAALLPSRASLLRAPFVQQIVLEDWLLDHAPRQLAPGH